jgi:hypothetical protein
MYGPGKNATEPANEISRASFNGVTGAACTPVGTAKINKLPPGKAASSVHAAQFALVVYGLDGLS